MGLFLKQTEQRSQLQTKIAADLSERLHKQTLDTGTATKPQPTILDDQRATSPLAWLWLLLGVLAVVGLVFVLSR